MPTLETDPPERGINVAEQATALHVLRKGFHIHSWKPDVHSNPRECNQGLRWQSSVASRQCTLETLAWTGPKCEQHVSN